MIPELKRFRKRSMNCTRCGNVLAIYRYDSLSSYSFVMWKKYMFETDIIKLIISRDTLLTATLHVV